MTVLALAMALLLGGDSLKTEVIFLGRLPSERAIMLWDRVIGSIGGATILQGRSPDVVVVRDTPPRLARFRALVTALDATSPETHIYLRPVVNVRPSELAALVQSLADGADALRDVTLVPDDRSDQLVVAAPPARYRALDKLLRRLDVPPRSPRKVIGVEPEPEGGLPR